MTAELSPEVIREFVIAAHGNLEKVKTMLAENPALLTAAHQWGEDDFENGLGAAAHVGNREIAEFFLAQNVPLTLCAAAALGRVAAVSAFLDADASLANGRGAHGIPVMFHAAMSGSTELAGLLRAGGCVEGYNAALHGAVAYGHSHMVEWLLDNGATDLQVKNYEGRTPLAKALEYGHDTIAGLLRARGAVE